MSLVLVVTACGQESRPAPEARGPVSRPADVDPPPSTFVRQIAGENGELPRLETAIVGYRRKSDGVRVDLVAEVHIADPEHYAEVQRRLAGYDAVLYELVASPDDRPTPGLARQGSGGPLGFVQRRISETLGFAFQLDALDYRRDNFVHADMDPGELADAFEESGITPLGLIARALMTGAVRPEDAGEPIDMVAALRAGRGKLALRRQWAMIMRQVDVVTQALEGTPLLDGRNEKALAVMEEQAARGVRHMAIHYGAGHMPSMERSLVEDLGFEKVDEDWILAWRLDEGILDDGILDDADPDADSAETPAASKPTQSDGGEGEARDDEAMPTSRRAR